jgi:hypothetical protein
MAKTAATAKVTPLQPLTLGKAIDDLYQLREQIREINAKLKPLEEAKKSAEETILGLLDAQGVDKSSGKLATASISETVVAQIEDFDSIWAFARKSNTPQLFERRIANAPFRELLEQRKGKPIPGLQSFTKRTLNLRVRSD